MGYIFLSMIRTSAFCSVLKKSAKTVQFWEVAHCLTHVFIAEDEQEILFTLLDGMVI